MRALALFSGGLDSLLAMKLVIDQGIDVTAINVNFGLGSNVDKSAHIENMCNQIGADFKILDLRQEYLDEVLFEPKYGYGKHFNPCIDCHAFMFRHTAKLLKEFNGDFMISGEVIGQRPMSQRKDAMETVRVFSDNEDLIVRPLCAKLLPPTKPEREGWIDREKLLDISGRNRQRQLALVEEYGIKDYETPGGGCLLTQEQFSDRLRDFVEHDQLEVEDMNTLKFGRHFRLPNGAKLIVGRDKEDNEKLEATDSKKYYKARIADATGPFVLFSKNASKEDQDLAVNMIITYGKTELDKTYTVKFFEDGKEVMEKQGVKSPTKEEASKYLI